MKIRELHQRAFGRFTDHQLTFGSGDRRDAVPGLHVVYGSNEAGKTTTLHAIRYGLYGIPDLRNDPRTYDFLHRKPDLRIGMVLEADSGGLIQFTRRKKTGETCFDFADTSPDPAAQQKLDALLRGVDRDLFTRKYGIDHPSLREGGEGLASERDSLGESLFAATTGIVGIHSTLKALAKQTEALLKGTGRSGEIHDATKRFKDAESVVRKAHRAGRQLHPKQAELERANTELRATQADITQTSVALEQARAINDAVATVLERAALLDEIGALGPVLEKWSTDRELQRVKLRNTISDTEDALAGTTRELANREAEAEELLADTEHGIPEIADRVQQCSERIAEYLNAKASEARLRAAQDQAASEVTNACRLVRVGADAARPRDLIPPLAATANARVLLDTHTELQRKASDAKQALVESEDALKGFNAQDEISAISTEGLDFLEAALDGVEKVDTARLAQIEQTLSAQEKQLSSLVAALSRSAHDLNVLLNLAAPLEATIDDFDHRLREADTDVKQARAALADADEQLREQEAAIEELKQTQHVSSSEDLAATRDARDTRWRQIRAAWLNEPTSDGADSIAPGTETAIAEAFEAAITESDQHADRRTAAGAIIGQLTAAETRRGALIQDIARRQTSLEALEQHQNQVRGEWRQLWSALDIDPGTATEMRAWLSDLAEIRRAASELASHGAEAQSLRERVERARRDLYNALKAVDARPPAEDISVEVLEARARQLIKNANQARERAIRREVERKGLERNRYDAKQRLERVEESLTDWSLKWSEAAASIGLAEDAPPDAGRGALQAMENLGAALEGLDAATRASEQNELTVTSFESDAHELLSTVGGELASTLQDKPAESIVRELSTRADSSQKAMAGLAALRPTIQSLRERQADERRVIAGATEELVKLAAEAGQSSPEDLDRAAELWNTREGLHAQIKDRDIQIIKITKMPPDEVVAYLGGTTAEQLPIRISELQEKLNELDIARSAEEQGVEELRNQVAQLKVDAQVEQALADLADARAELEQLANRYVRLKLEHDILGAYLRDKAAGQIGPALTRAGELFKQLTCGRYLGVAQDVNDDDVPVLKVLRDAGSSMDRVGLSTGTSDQLYLALRIASIYQQLDQPGQEPIPFIVDDILTTFDDDRSAATMSVLAELATRTQVIFFTHHQHLVDLARRQVPLDTLHVVSLDPDLDDDQSLDAVPAPDLISAG